MYQNPQRYFEVLKQIYGAALGTPLIPLLFAFGRKDLIFFPNFEMNIFLEICITILLLIPLFWVGIKYYQGFKKYRKIDDFLLKIKSFAKNVTLLWIVISVVSILSGLLFWQFQKGSFGVLSLITLLCFSLLPPNLRHLNRILSLSQQELAHFRSEAQWNF
ncbi:hypothetical protein [Hugenholtzia roseola]|uniref:hypothetical protein n=1 Tax=Hugenholtzia roseola TaxID=1002 RepID=UPI000427F682|nr:hypothetical protein [Hugenholtzia roseola]